MNPTLVFAHANGFPAGAYRQLLEAWRAAGWQVHALPMFGHDPADPVASIWRRLRDQLIDFTGQHAPGGAWLVGHSLGGLLSLMTAGKRPDLAHGLVMPDAPVITGWRAHSLRVLKASALVQTARLAGQGLAQPAPPLAIAKGGTGAFRGQIDLCALGTRRAGRLHRQRYRAR